MPFAVGCDTSDVAVSATLNQEGHPVAFVSRFLHGSEMHYPAIEKGTTAVIEAVRKWSHFLRRQHFTLITDQRWHSCLIENELRSRTTRCSTGDCN